MATKHDGHPNHPPYRNLEPSPNEGLYLRRLDEKQAAKEGAQLVPVFWLVIILALLASPFIHLQNLVRTDQVHLIEANPHLETQFDGYTMAKFTSIYEAENWLLENGYKVRRLDTRPFGSYRWGEDYLKTFYVKGQIGSMNESVVAISVDYGNGQWHLYPFTTTDASTPLDFSRFERSRVPARWKHRTPFVLGFYSTHEDISFFQWLLAEQIAVQVHPDAVEREQKELDKSRREDERERLHDEEHLRRRVEEALR